MSVALVHRACDTPPRLKLNFQHTQLHRSGLARTIVRLKCGQDRGPVLLPASTCRPALKYAAIPSPPSSLPKPCREAKFRPLGGEFVTSYYDCLPAERCCTRVGTSALKRTASAAHGLPGQAPKALLSMRNLRVPDDHATQSAHDRPPCACPRPRATGQGPLSVHERGLNVSPTAARRPTDCNTK
eukprot:366029-Chlamydomonas_euryale.AAC.12